MDVGKPISPVCLSAWQGPTARAAFKFPNEYHSKRQCDIGIRSGIVALCRSSPESLFPITLSCSMLETLPSVLICLEMPPLTEADD